MAKEWTVSLIVVLMMLSNWKNAAKNDNVEPTLVKVKVKLWYNIGQSINLPSSFKIAPMNYWIVLAFLMNDLLNNNFISNTTKRDIPLKTLHELISVKTLLITRYQLDLTLWI